MMKSTDSRLDPLLPKVSKVFKAGELGLTSGFGVDRGVEKKTAKVDDEAVESGELGLELGGSLGGRGV